MSLSLKNKIEEDPDFLDDVWFQSETPRFLSGGGGFLTDNVYENNTQSIAELKAAINQKIHAVQKKECIKVIDNFARQIRVCHQRNGGYLEHIL